MALLRTRDFNKPMELGVGFILSYFYKHKSNDKKYVKYHIEQHPELFY